MNDRMIKRDLGTKPRFSVPHGFVALWPFATVNFWFLRARAHACVNAASGHALTSTSHMKFFLHEWLHWLNVCFCTCSAAPQKEQSERRKTHNICDLLGSRNIRWISVTLWMVWWAPRCAVRPPQSVHWPCTCTMHTDTHSVDASPRTWRPISLMTNNDLSGAVKPAAKIKLRSCIRAQYDRSSCHFLTVSENRRSLILLSYKLFHFFFSFLISCTFTAEVDRCYLHRNTVTIAYFALSLNTANLHGNAYFNCFLSAVVEMPAYTLSWVMFRWCSRRLSLSSALIMGGIFLLLIQLIPAGTTPQGASTSSTGAPLRGIWIIYELI